MSTWDGKLSLNKGKCVKSYKQHIIDHMNLIEAFNNMFRDKFAITRPVVAVDILPANDSI